MESLLIGIHTGLASLTKTPELAISDSEANMLAKATAKVMALYEIKVNPHAEAWGQMIVVCGMVYGPRLAALTIKRQMRRTPPPRQGEDIQEYISGMQ